MRLWTLDEVFRRWPSLRFRIVFETALPCLAALIWGGKTFITSGSLFSALTAAGLAFTAVLYVQGQILRMAKNVRNERDAEEFRRSFSTVHEAIAEVNQSMELEASDPGSISREQAAHIIASFQHGSMLLMPLISRLR